MYKQILLGAMLPDVTPNELAECFASDPIMCTDPETADFEIAIGLGYVGVPLIVAADGWANIEPLSSTDVAIPLGHNADALLEMIPWLADISSETENAVMRKWDLARAAAHGALGLDLSPAMYLGVEESSN